MAINKSEIWAEIKPYVVEQARDLIRRAGASGVASGGGGIFSGTPSPHALSSAHHTGVMLDTQIPQALLVDGSRALLGDWAVAPGVEIDGVDVSAHAIGNPDAHHNRIHVLATGTALGADHQISGAAAGDVLRALTGTTARFEKLKHTDLDPATVTANQHHAQIHVLATDTALGPDHQISGAATGDVLRAVGGTAARFEKLNHTDLNPASVTIDQHHPRDHGIVGSTHTYSGGLALDVVGLDAPGSIAMLRPSFDVGTVPAAAILKSNAAGKLTLGQLDVTGPAFVGQNFDAANGAFRVIYHAAGVPIPGEPPPVDHAHVIVNPNYGWTTVDESMGVEVIDNMRVWGYLIANLTLQVPDMEPVIPFDGAFPFETNYTGSAIASGGQHGRAAPGCKMPIFRPGKFAKSAEFTRAATNLFTNPSAEIDSTSYANNGGATHGVVTTHYYFGTKSIRVQTGTGNFDGIIAIGPTHAATTDYTAIVWIERTEIEADLIISLRRNTSTEMTKVAVPKRLGWQPVTVAGTTAGTTGSLRLYVQKDNDGDVVVFYIDGVSMYQSAYCVPTAHGAMTQNEGNDAHSWAGTAHASQTNVLATGLVYPSTSPIFTVGANGSFGCWTRVPWRGGSGNGGAAHYLFTAGDDNLSLRSNASGNFVFIVGGSAATAFAPPAGFNADWHLFFVTWNDDTNLVKLWIDGVVHAQTTYVGPTTLADMTIGCSNAGINQLDGQLDHIMNVSRELEPEEMKAIFEADGPAFAFRSIANLRFGRNRFYMDDEGFWGTGASGRRLVAMYAGVDGVPLATKGWGGVNLSEGDILFGERGTAGGYMYFDQNGGGATPRWSFGYNDGATDFEVLQLDWQGATLYGVLDILAQSGAAGGGIWQGSAGTFLAPGTGLKIWNDGGVGRIATYSGTVEQVSFNTSGQLVAGAGNVRLDANGLTIARGPAASNRVEWTNGIGGPTTALLYDQLSGSTQNLFGLSAQDSARANQLMLQATSSGSNEARVYIVAETGADSAYINILNTGGVTSLQAIADQLYLDGNQISINAPTVGVQGQLNVVGGLALTGVFTVSENLTLANTKFLASDIVRARDASGLQFQDKDGVAAINIADGGDVTLYTPLTLNENVTMADTKIFSTDRVRARDTGGLRAEELGGALGLFVQDSTGFVGIKQTNPLHHLHIGGNSVSGEFAVVSGAGTRKFIIKAHDSGLFAHFGTETATDFRIVRGNVEALSVNATGVGINAAATAQLEVISGAAGRMAAIFNSAASPTADIFKIQRAGVEKFTVTAEGWGKFVSTAVSGGVDNVGGRLILQSVKPSAGANFDMAGQLRFMARNSGNTDKVFVDVNGQIDVATANSETGGLYINTQHGGGDAIPFAAVGANVAMLRNAVVGADFKGAKGVLWLAAVHTAPTNPPDGTASTTNSGGVFIWYDSFTNKIRYRKPGGAATDWV